jgi:hypothetical protein
VTLYLLKVHLQTFLSIPITQKCQIFELWHSCLKWAIRATLSVVLLIISFDSLYFVVF